MEGAKNTKFIGEQFARIVSDIADSIGGIGRTAAAEKEIWAKHDFSEKDNRTGAKITPKKAIGY